MTKELYRTTNFHIAVWLIMNDKDLVNVEWSGKNRAEFIFEDFDNRDELIQKFFDQEQIQQYISGSQKLKARMYAFHSPTVYDRSK
jgi:hypothetical protein